MIFAYRTITVYGLSFHNNSANQDICNSPIGLHPDPFESHNPDRATHAGYHTRPV